MRGLSLPLEHPAPDGREFVEILAGRSSSPRVPLVEYIVDDVVMKPVVEGMLGRTWVKSRDRQGLAQGLRSTISFSSGTGWDTISSGTRRASRLPEMKLIGTDPVAPSAPRSQPLAARAWADEHRGAIMSWEDFERYPWPKPEEFDFFPFEYLNRNLPEGMGLISCHGGRRVRAPLLDHVHGGPFCRAPRRP